jgi:hypothetical protein
MEAEVGIGFCNEPGFQHFELVQSLIDVTIDSHAFGPCQGDVVLEMPRLRR